jgi:hypothetical protein
MDKLQVEFVVLILNQLMLFQKNLDQLEEEEVVVMMMMVAVVVEEEDSWINHKDQDSLDELN